MSTTATDSLPLFVWGASGMLAGELFRLLERHPSFSIEGAVTRGERDLAAAHPHLADVPVATSPDRALGWLAERLEERERAAVVLALPHGASADAWRRLTDGLGPAAAERLFVCDLAADFRLKDPELYERTYGSAHPAPDELDGFAYGLPELYRADLDGARRVAAPGCFATALQLATVPAARAGIVDGERTWVLHALTGSSGSGALPKPGTHHPHRHGNLWAYGLGGHRHEAELEQALAREGLAPPISFVPHSGPFVRGIHLTAALPLADAGLDPERARAVFETAYAGEPFVDVLPLGAAPDLRSVAGSNRVQIGVAVRSGVLTVLLTLDNLVKGGAGQGLQALNRIVGLPETTGLPRTGLGVA